MRPDDPCELGYAVVDLYAQVSGEAWAKELRDRYLEDPEMDCERVILEVTERGSIEHLREVDRRLPSWQGPSREELLAEAARRGGRRTSSGYAEDT